MKRLVLHMVALEEEVVAVAVLQPVVVINVRMAQPHVVHIMEMKCVGIQMVHVLKKETNVEQPIVN
jgi:hypothetical protein